MDHGHGQEYESDAHAAREARARADDRRFLRMSMDDGARAGHCVLEERLLTPDGRLYGGAALGIAVAAMEATTGRRLIWATAQYVRTAYDGDAVQWVVEVVAAGRRSSQVQVRASVDGDLVFTVVGATGALRPDGFAGVFAEMPEVEAPEASPVLVNHTPLSTRPGCASALELRSARPLDHRRHAHMWARSHDNPSSRPAMIAFLADFLPQTISEAGGVFGAGTSLDNTIRIGPPVDCEWVLLDLRGDIGWGGYGHGTGYVWSPEGTLLAVVSQSVTMSAF